MLLFIPAFARPEQRYTLTNHDIPTCQNCNAFDLTISLKAGSQISTAGTAAMNLYATVDLHEFGQGSITIQSTLVMLV